MEQKNYITENGFECLKQELHDLVTKERPQLLQIITWAAGNGDRSENGDYIYGKKRLREIDKRIYILTKKLKNSEVINTSLHRDSKRVFFGAIVTILRNDTLKQTIRIVGQDEIDTKNNNISWTSPLAKALIHKNIGDIFTLKLPRGEDTIEVLDISY